MLTNSDCTIYSRTMDPATGYSVWKRQYIPQCWWFEDNQSTVTTEGLRSASVLTVRIPDMSVAVKRDDYIVKGNCPVEMRTVKDLESYAYYRVTKANYNMFGGCRHIKVVGE